MTTGVVLAPYVAPLASFASHYPPALSFRAPRETPGSPLPSHLGKLRKRYRDPIGNNPPSQISSKIFGVSNGARPIFCLKRKGEGGDEGLRRTSLRADSTITPLFFPSKRPLYSLWAHRRSTEWKILISS